MLSNQMQVFYYFFGFFKNKFVEFDWVFFLGQGFPINLKKALNCWKDTVVIKKWTLLQVYQDEEISKGYQKSMRKSTIKGSCFSMEISNTQNKWKHLKWLLHM